MRWFRRTLTAEIIGGLLLSWTLAASAQTTTAPAPKPKAPQAAPMPSGSAQMPKSSATAPTTASQPRQRVVIVEPIRVFDPFFDYPYPYAYAPDYMAENFGYVKLDTKMKDASVYVDGGFADKVEKAKKFALRPGTHNIELRDSDGRPIFKESVAVLVGKTTTLHVG